MSTMTLDQAELGRRALVNWKKRQGQYQGLARAFTGNPMVTVVPTAGTPCTDGSKIWLHVPLALGLDLKHEPGRCNIRDDDGILLCRACHVDEDVDITLIHEIAHQTEASFMDLDLNDLTETAKRAVRLLGNQQAGSRAEKLRKVITKRGPSAANYVALARLVSPHMPNLLNAMEDTRVNRKMMTKRPGTVRPFGASLQGIFRDGVQQPDGSRELWKNYPANLQALMALMCKAHGYEYAKWLDPDVVAAVQDRQLDELIAALNDTETMRQVFALAFPMLERLRELGFFKDPDDPEDDPKEENEEDDESESTSMGEPCESGDPSDQDQDDEPGNGGANPDDQDDDSDPSSDPQGDDSDDDDADDAEGEGAGDGTPDDSADDDGEGSAEGDDADSDSPGSGESDEEAPGDAGDGEGSGAGEREDDERSPDQSGRPGEPSGEPGQDGSPQDGDGDPEQDGDQLEGKPYDGDLEMGRPNQVSQDFNTFSGHNQDGTAALAPVSELDGMDEYEQNRAVELAILQMDFDSPSLYVGGFQEFHFGTYDHEAQSWEHYTNITMPDMVVPETLLMPAVQKLRTIFTDNRRHKVERNLKRGRRIDGKTLARRVPFDDPRVFHKRSIPGKKDYFVLVVIDVSSSVEMRTQVRQGIKTAAFAKATMLDRLGIPFGLYAHTAGGNNQSVQFYRIKGPDEVWGKEQQEALRTIGGSGYNLDGHAMEQARKILMARTEREKILMYYTDGEMPLSNKEEETEILTREIKLMEKAGVSVVGVGWGTDSPKQHGLDTVEINQVEDIGLVVKKLEEKLSGR